MSGIPGNLQDLGAKFFGLDDEAPDADAKPSARKVAQAKAEALANDYRAAFSTAAGRRVLADLIERTLHKPTFDARMGLMNGTAYGFAREGQNSLVHFIRRQVAIANKET